MRAFPAPAAPSVVVLVFHGGSADNNEPAEWRGLAVARMVPLAKSLARHLPDSAVYLLKHRIRGWNGQGASALADADWALDIAREEHPGVPIVLVGHSMGGRTAMRRSAAAGVVGAVLLAPWLPPGDPVDHLAGVPLRVIHARTDLVVPGSGNRPWLARARAAGALIDTTQLRWTGHSMLRRFGTWHRLSAQGVRQVLSAVGLSADPR